MKRPSFQFYPGDWSSSPNLKRCSFAEKGIWIEVMCLMHDQPEYGVLRWPLREIAEAVKCRPADLIALQRKGVLKGDDTHLDEAYIYVPRSGRKDGVPVTLLDTQAGPIWYSSRMVKDEYVRTIRADSSANGDASKATPKDSPKPPLGEAIGGGFGPRGSSSSSSPSGKEQSNLTVAPGHRPDDRLADDAPAKPKPPGLPECPHLEILALWAEVLPAMPQHEPELWRGTRADHLRARWRETAAAKGWQSREQGLTYFRRLFGYIGESDFLTGRATTRDGKRPFVAKLEWVLLPSNWAKVIEGNYHEVAA